MLEQVRTDRIATTGRRTRAPHVTLARYQRKNSALGVSTPPSKYRDWATFLVREGGPPSGGRARKQAATGCGT